MPRKWRQFPERFEVETLYGVSWERMPSHHANKYIPLLLAPPNGSSRRAEARKTLRPLKNNLEIRLRATIREVPGAMLVAKVIRTRAASRRLPGISPMGERLGGASS